MEIRYTGDPNAALHRAAVSVSDDPAVIRQTEEFLQSHLAEMEILEAYEDGLKGVLLYEPQEMRIRILAAEDEAAEALLDALLKKAEDLHYARVSASAFNHSMEQMEKHGFVYTGEKTVSSGIESAPMEYLLGRKNLGRTVKVIIDRPYGSFHPHLPDVLYPLNYGYVDDPGNAEGEFQDAYVYGPQEPLETFTGTVIAIIYHKDDSRSRWIVGRIGETADRDEVISAVGFEEQYYESYIEWNTFS